MDYMQNGELWISNWIANSTYWIKSLKTTLKKDVDLKTVIGFIGSRIFVLPPFYISVYNTHYMNDFELHYSTLIIKTK